MEKNATTIWPNLFHELTKHLSFHPPNILSMAKKKQMNNYLSGVPKHWFAPTERDRSDRQWVAVAVDVDGS